MPKSRRQLAADLEAILAPFTSAEKGRYRTASWLESEFEDDVWRTNVLGSVTIDWRVHLDDGTLLTARKNEELLEVFKSFVILQTHPDTNGGRVASSRSISNTVARAIHCIDYFLVRSAEFNLAASGLRGVTTDMLKGVLKEISSDKNISSGVYRWPLRLAELVRSSITHSEPPERSRGDSGEATPSGGLTDLSVSEISLAQEWLKRASLYSYKPGAYRCTINRRAIAQLLYADTLAGQRTHLPLPHELCIDASPLGDAELPRARVVSDSNGRMKARLARRYAKTLSGFSLLSQEGLPCPSASSEEMLQAIEEFDLQSNGRFRTPPLSVVMLALREAVEFIIKFGDPIVDILLEAATEAKTKGMRLSSLLEEPAWLTRKIGSGDEIHFAGWRIAHGRYSDRKQYYRELRSRPGLFECLSLLQGAATVVVGALSARREGELRSVTHSDPLDKTETRIVFQQGKTGSGDYRHRTSRPLAPIGVRCIKILQRLQSGIASIFPDINSSDLSVFSRIREREPLGFIRLTSPSYRRAMDLFFDWIEMPCNDAGERHYLRQHQFRRCFVMLFFYGDGFSSIDTLRWYLGHTDAKHLWHYITESVPGSVLRSVAAGFAAYQVRHSTREAEALAEVLKQELGVSEFSVIDDETLSDHVNHLIEEGLVRVEPHFLDNGSKYRIAISVHKAPTKRG
ncbi:hypothetical protein EN794_034880 [Mesorhizobium sp. M00.F.Ca.ET.151.01.1.1]|nr:hypothetical protein EN842_25425 [bacterium M00.F.Ca.ET.199.01.1.1]TGS98005.1 hypothetical protein EN820_37445 [bacterium M00.F.Ca.ET.177.01.1.1]TGT59058.1 hypothetical protein EN813_030110 [Mesorhizobium sp. M00.F.Ca.ET.170.01.1.1]TGU11121.1 hypothetical protein EN806_25045 [bacterium M00.F.Ca.ET.163.01.1.1]TGU92761.1 hypothetical protein EN794_034880 [Mesorhizobium sp. M00.F.Ca.ET.151.01.1.1]TGV54683.1 hypothetical protein EN784_34195 [bacterium M00.F.Ca.ET.141.01.1.1]